MSKPTLPRICLHHVSAALLFAAASLMPIISASAQDTAQTSSGELKDFRLDNPAPKEKEAEPLPKPDPVAAQPKQETAPVLKTETNQKAKKSSAVQSTRSETKSQQPNGAVEQAVKDEETAPPSAAIPENAVAAPIAKTEPPTAQTGGATNILQYWPFLVALISALAGLALFGIWKRRRATAIEDVIQPEAFEAEPAPPPMLPIAEPVAEPVALAGTLTTQFDPENARLSVANLTVTGRLQLRYNGDAPLETLRLRTLMISVGDDQKTMIESFHSDPQMGQVNSLGPVVPGEEIKMKLELQLPRDALQAFDWRERRFVAPIVLINIASEGHAIDPVRITTLVGQTGDAASSRLLPLPIDRGPKLFDALQFRPIAA